MLSSYKHTLVSVLNSGTRVEHQLGEAGHIAPQTDTDRGVYQHMCAGLMASFHDGDAVLTDNTQLGQATL
jgi:hypothetical protein